jgi:hypothetical protein
LLSVRDPGLQQSRARLKGKGGMPAKPESPTAAIRIFRPAPIIRYIRYLTFSPGTIAIYSAIASSQPNPIRYYDISDIALSKNSAFDPCRGCIGSSCTFLRGLTAIHPHTSPLLPQVRRVSLFETYTMSYTMRTLLVGSSCIGGPGGRR